MSRAASGELARVTTRQARLERTREQMRELGLEAVLLSVGADLPWLCGYEAMPLERPTVLVVPLDDTPTLVVPELEAARVANEGELVRVRPWSETEDPIALIGMLVGKRTRLAFSDRAFAALLLELQHALPSASIVRASLVTGPLRAVKDEAEIAALRAAGAAADTVSHALLGGEIALIGRTELEVSAEISARLRAAGHATVEFAIVASGPNAASPHHEASAREIGVGETVVCDFGGILHLDGDVGYCSDTTRTIVTGEPGAQVRELYAVVEEAQRRALEAVAVGVACEDIDRVARDHITEAGYGEAFIHRTGHGIGIEVHEDPYLVSGNVAAIAAGNAFSIEPGIYLAGRCGTRIEDIVIATAGETIRCNVVDHSLHLVEA